MGVASLILGIFAVILCWIPVVNWLGIILGVVGIILGAIGISKAKKNGQGKGTAVAGLVLSIVATAIAAIAWMACSACGACGAASELIDAADYASNFY